MATLCVSSKWTTHSGGKALQVIAEPHLLETFVESNIGATVRGKDNALGKAAIKERESTARPLVQLWEAIGAAGLVRNGGVPPVCGCSFLGPSP